MPRNCLAPLLPSPCARSGNPQIGLMRKRTRNPGMVLPVMMAQLSAASWETMMRRSLLMASGTCSPAEYQRMVLEKAAATQLATAAFWTGKGSAAQVTPFLTRAKRNARRLRRGGP